MGGGGSKEKTEITPTRPAPGFTGKPPEGALTATTVSGVDMSTRDPRNSASLSKTAKAVAEKGMVLRVDDGSKDDGEYISVIEHQAKVTENFNRMVREEPDGVAARAMELLADRGYKTSTSEEVGGFLSTMPLASKLKVPKATAQYLSKEERDQITAREGLNIGAHQKRQLAESFWFTASSDPIQHGIDAGIIGGVGAMAYSAYFPKNRVAGLMAVRFAMGFTAGMSSLVTAMLLWTEYQSWGKYDARKQASEDRRRSFYAQRIEKDG